MRRNGNRWKKYNLDQRRWRSLRYDIQMRDGYRCVICQSTAALEIDHIVPLALGGHRYDPDNLQTLCKKCHQAKGVTESPGRLTHKLIPGRLL